MVHIFGKVVLHSFIPHVCAAVGVDSMKTMDGMKVPVSFTSLLVIHSHSKVSSSWMDGFLRLSRVFMLLYFLWLLGLRWNHRRSVRQ